MPRFASLLLILLLALICGLEAPPAAASELGWKELPTHRHRDLAVPPGEKAGFTLLANAETGILFTNLLAASRHYTNSMLLNGSGVAAGDFDGDGLCDLYFCGLDNSNALFRNLGNWRFTNITEQAGLACNGIDSTGATFADLDADHDLDLIVNTFRIGTLMFKNEGNGKFSPWVRSNVNRAGMSTAVGDLNEDGWLDLYVVNYRSTALIDMPYLRFTFKEENGRRVIDQISGKPANHPDLLHRFVINARGGIDETGEPDMILRNVGGTNFTELAFDDGSFMEADGTPLKLPPFDWGLSVLIRDINRDGRPDIYVCNDFDSPDRIWLNQGGGKFKAIGPLAIRKTSFYSMGGDFADIDRDGWDDFFVLDMASHDPVRTATSALPRQQPTFGVGDIQTRAEYMINTLLRNRGDGTYAEIASLAGVWATEWSWAEAFVDVDLDGYEDILVLNGYERDARNMDVQNAIRAARSGKQLSFLEQMEFRKLFPRLDTPNVAFRNNGDLTFQDKSAEWGFDLAAVSHGLCLADLDNDGDLDAVVNNMNKPAVIYRNDSSAPRLAVSLLGVPPNTAGIGARITVKGGPVEQSQEMMGGGRYLSADAPMRVFAAGNKVMQAEVLWPNGTKTVASNLPPNSVVQIKQSAAASVPPAEKAVTAPLFVEAADFVHHHIEQSFDDFTRQPMLSRKLSQEGPGVAFGDLNGDGADELVVTSGRSGKLAVFENKAGRFSSRNGVFNSSAGYRDQMAVLPLLANGAASCLVSLSNYEDGAAGAAGLEEYSYETGIARVVLPAREYSFGAMTMADIDNDGPMELFAAGRVLPGKYPVRCSSVMLRQQEGKWVVDERHAEVFKDLGLVTSAVLVDINQDGWVDLLTACNPGPIQLFLNREGRFHNASSEWGLQSLTGLWNGIAVGDFDRDGRLDFAAGNWGWNQPHFSGGKNPLLIYHGDFDQNGMHDLIEGYVQPESGRELPLRGLDYLSPGLPVLKEKYKTYGDFGRASISDLLSGVSAEKLVVQTLASTAFLNRRNRFEARPLPTRAQFAPVFGIASADFDGDGIQDLALAENFFATAHHVYRWDAGCGLILRGVGNGDFVPLSPSESGLNLPGEQRGLSVSDVDLDGRIDLAIGQNAGPTRVLMNKRAVPGRVVQVEGPAENRDGVGSVIVGSFGAMAITKGSGWLSCESTRKVISGTSEQIILHWRGRSKVFPVTSQTTGSILRISLSE